MRSKILKALRESDGYVSGQDLCGIFGVSRTAVWKAVNKLKEEGYEIESSTHKGYRLLNSPDVVIAEELKSIRKTKWIGEEVRYFEATDTTNLQAKYMGDSGSVHGAYAVADKQVEGRGRRGRAWESPAGEGIFMSLLLRPDFPPQVASMLTLVAAMSVVKALREFAMLPAQIKWPNDIVLNGKKICGILTEMNAEVDFIKYVIVGIGVNVSNRVIPEEIRDKATSIYLETGNKMRRAPLIEAIWEQFEAYYEVFTRTNDLSEIYKEYNKYLVNINQQVKVLDPKDSFEGKAVGITKTGELIVDTWEARRLVSSGEVSVRGIYGYV